MSNLIKQTRAAHGDILYIEKYDKQSYNKFKEIYKYLLDNDPPYSVFRAEKFGKHSECPGCWSMHLTQKHRLVFVYSNKVITILRARGHYDDN